MNFDYFAQEMAATVVQKRMTNAEVHFKNAIEFAAMKGEQKVVCDFQFKLPIEMIQSLEDYGIRVDSIGSEDGKHIYTFDISEVGC